MKRKQLLKKRNQNVLSPIFERLEEMILMTAVPGGTPEYFGENGVGNWAFSPQPDPTTGTGGILKFQDSLPGLGAANANNLGQYLPVAVADTTTYPGSDYYEIALIQYTEKLSTSLNPTTLRGYVQVETTSNAAVSHHYPLTYPSGAPILNALGTQVFSVDPPQYLGTEIMASRDLPVRVKFTNYLPIGAGGDLFLPVDNTSMGAGLGPIQEMVTAADRVGGSGNVVQIATQTAHNLSVGELVSLQQFQPLAYNGLYHVTQVTDATHFQVSLYEDPGSSATRMGMTGAAYTEDRATLHLHGGVTPWISDGTQNQWITPAGDTTPYPVGVSVVNVPDMPAPEPGSMTFFYTNQESARMMFYHDHSLGLTRLNVYAGEEAAYMLTDAVEQDLIARGILPGLGTPLIMQDKGFIDPNTIYKTDPTWPIPVNPSNNDLWTPHVWMPNQNPNDVTGANGFGRWDYGPWFWPPWSVTNLPIQGVGGITVTNPGTGYTMPPMVTITPAAGDTGANAHATATIDATGAVTAITLDTRGDGYNLPPTITITPAPGDTTGTGATATAEAWVYPNVPNISQTMEAYQDTAMVNGTPYPFMNVDPTTYRFRILNAADDRMLNLQLYTSSSIMDTMTLTSGGSGYTLPPMVHITPAPGDTTGYGATAEAVLDATGTVIGLNILTVGSGYTLAPVVTIDAPLGAGTAATATATVYTGTSEVGMVPAVPGVANFPASWRVQTPGQVGDILDSRLGGIPDPRNIGPSMIQIGTDGGFLPSPVLIDNKPIGYERNPKMITIGNVSQRALLLGPAERADILIDFSQYAGKTIIIYNDAPTGIPAADSRLDYFTNDGDQTGGGGTANTQAGYGPNTRTFMVFHVGLGTGTPTPYNLAALQAEFTTTATHNGVFMTDQLPITVPQAAYNSAYGANFPATTMQYAKIASNAMTFYPYDSTTASKLSATPVTIPLQPKAIQETFEGDYGRMMANIGVEIPNTNGTNQTTISYSLIDPATEVMNGSTTMVPLGTTGDGTQFWKITHNGVDTHAIHFHLFSIQLINRVQWDGQIVPPDANELGWKDTVRMNPLEDTIIALRPLIPKLNFGVPDSIHALDPTQPIGSTMGFTGIDPNGLPVTVTNQVVNFGWEYVWHCHVLSHEEMTMMRPMVVNVTSLKPIASVLTPPIVTTVQGAALTWTDGTPVNQPSTFGNMANEVGFRIERALFVNNVIGTYVAVGNAIANSTGFVDTTAVPGQQYYYRVVAYNAAGETASNAVFYNPTQSIPTLVGTSTPTGWYNAGKSVSIQVTFNDTETVTGLPRLLLNNGQFAIYSGGTGTSVLTFTYLVAAGIGVDIARLDFASTRALQLNGGSIVGSSSLIPAALTLPPPRSTTQDLLYSANIGIDTTAPVVTGRMSPTAPSSTGWYNRSTGAPRYSYTATDALSGLLSASTGTYTFPDGANQSHVFSVTDRAGNVGTATIAGVNVDTVAPVLTARISTVASTGWYNIATGPATVTYTATDLTSGVTAPPNYVFPQGNNLSRAAITVTDRAGNVSAAAGAFSNIKVDTTAPVATPPAPMTVPMTDATGASVVYTGGSATDALSGVLSTAFNPVSGSHFLPGTTTVTYSALDVAGNTGTSTFPVTVLNAGIVGTELVITGTAGNDAFVIDSTNPAAVTVTLNGTAIVGSPFNIGTGRTIRANGLAGNDTFTMIGGVGGTLDGGTGTNTFTVSAWTAPAATIVGSGADTIIAARDANFVPTPTNLTIGTQVIVMSGVTRTNLTGGVSDNTFDVTGWTGSGSFTGGGGVDTIISTRDANYTLTNTSLAIGAQALTLSAIGVASLTGGLSANTFTVSGWTGSGTLTGGGGLDTVVAVRDASFTLTNTSLAIGTQTLALSAIGVANLTGGVSANSFTVTGWTGAGTLTGGGGSDTVIATSDSNFTLTNTSLVIGTQTLTLSAIGLATLTGGIGNNTFTVTGWTGGGSLIGGGGSDTIVTVQNTNFILTNTSLAIGTQTLTLSAIGVARLTGGASNNLFDLTGWTGTGTMTGGGGTDRVLVTKNANIALSNTAITATDGLNTVLSGISTATLTGGIGNNLFSLNGWTGNATVTGGGGSDTLNATANSNMVLVDASLSIGTQVITLSAIGIANLTGGAANNSFTITGWTGTGSLTGGGGTDSVVATSNSNFVLTNTALTIGTQVIALSAIQSATLTGGAAANSFTVTGWTGTGTLTGGGGTDSVINAGDVDMTLTNTNLTASNGLNLTLSAITTDTLTLNNPVTSRTINASAFTGVSNLFASGAGTGKILGGSNNDTLTDNGSGPAVAVGNAGNDTIISNGNGRALLIGGDGADTISSSGGSAGTGQSILIGSRTTYDANLVALDAILASWNSANTYTQRVNNLLAGITGGYQITALTVPDDLAINNLTNSAASNNGQSWFVTRARDVVTKRTADTRTTF
ncbi:MAG: HYR domain-containing protein [Planctomycetota bacterium]